MSHQSLLTLLNQFHAEDKPCRKVYCSTCGGKVSVVKRSMTAELQSRITDVLENITLDDFLTFGEWCQFFREIDFKRVIGVYEREANTIDEFNIRKLDKFLFQARDVYNVSNIYNRILQKAIESVIEIQDESLIETIALILLEDIMNYEEFLLLAKSKSNKKIHRVLYNIIRELDPSVRTYLGEQ